MIPAEGLSVIDNPLQTELLIAKLKAAVPLSATVSPPLLALLQEQSPDLALPPRCQITRIHYAGDEGGILCKLDFGHEDDREVLYAWMNLAGTALRFFFKVTLGRVGFGDRLATVPSPERLPVVLSPEEVARLLGCAPGLKYRAALSMAYGCGLRVSEIIHLKIADIDSARMLIRVEQGKGRKDLYVMLAPDLLDLLRQWWWLR